MGMYCIDQSGHVFGWRKLGNPVPKIKDMTGVVRTVTVQHAPGLGGYPIGRGKEHARIEIALQGDPLTHPPARVTYIDHPVEADCITADVCNRFQPQSPSFGEHDRRNIFPCSFADQTTDDASQVG